MDKVKKILALLVVILTGAFLFERSRRKSNEAIADNKEMLDKLNELNKEKAKNDGQLASEEEKRNEIRKEADDRKSDDSSDVADFLKRR
jgi:hypothetical protein